MQRSNENGLGPSSAPSRHRRERFYERGARASSGLERLLDWLQHRFNALHVMAFFVGWGVARPRALAVARHWERTSHRWLYRDR